MGLVKAGIGKFFAVAAGGVAALSFALPANAQTAPQTSAPIAVGATADAAPKASQAQINKFIAQFPQQFRDVLDEYGKTKLGGALLSRVAAQGAVVDVRSNAVFFMSNGVRDGKPSLSLTQNVLALDMEKPADRASFMLNLTNELSTMQDSRSVWSKYIDKIEARDFSGAMEHMLMVEMASDAMQLQMAQELVNGRHYDLGTVEAALHDEEKGTGFSLTGAMSAESIKQQTVLDGERDLLTRALWWKYQPNSPYQQRVTDYVEKMHGPAAVNNAGALDDLKQRSGYTGSYDHTAQMYDTLSGQSGFAPKMESTMAPLRPYIAQTLAGLGVAPSPRAATRSL